MIVFYMFISIVSGISIVIARNINSMLGRKMGLLEGTFYNFLTGLLLSAILLISIGNLNFIKTISTENIPTWAYLGGLFGIAIVFLSNYVIPKVSAFCLTILVFLGQLLVGYVIDYINLDALSTSKLIGGILVFVGLSYNLYIDSSNRKAIKKCNETSLYNNY